MMQYDLPCAERLGIVPPIRALSDKAGPPVNFTCGGR